MLIAPTAVAQTPEVSSQNAFLDALTLHESGVSYEKVIKAYERAEAKSTSVMDTVMIQMSRLCYLQKNIAAIQHQKSKMSDWLNAEEKRLDSYAGSQTWFQSLYQISLTRLRLSVHPMWAELLKNSNHPLITPEFQDLIDEEIQNIRHPERILSDVSLPEEIENANFHTEDLILLGWVYFYLLHSREMVQRLNLQPINADYIQSIEHKFFEIMKAYASKKYTLDASGTSVDVSQDFKDPTFNHLLNIEVKIPKGTSVEKFIQATFGPKAWEMFEEKIKEMNPEVNVTTLLEEEKAVALPLKLWTLFPVKTEVEQIEEELKKEDPVQNEETKIADEEDAAESQKTMEEEESKSEEVILDDESASEALEEEKDEATETKDEQEKSQEKSQEESIAETIKDSFNTSALESQPEHADELSQMMEALFSGEGKEGQDTLYALYSPAYTPLYLRTFIEVRATPNGIMTEPDLRPDPDLVGDSSTIVDVQQVTGKGNTILFVPSEGAFKTFLTDSSKIPEFNPVNQSYLFNPQGLKDSQGMVSYQNYGRGLPKRTEELKSYETDLYKNSVYFETGGLTKEDVPQILRNKIESIFSDSQRSDEEKLSMLSAIVRNIIEYDKKLNERPRLVRESKERGTHIHRLFLQRLKIEETETGGLVLKQKPFGVCDSYAEIFVQFVRLFAQTEKKYPSRVAIGFTGEKGVVLGNHAHAWGEVYLPVKGWVRFEPTGSQRGGMGRGGNSLTDSLRGEAAFDSALDVLDQLDFDMIQPPREDGAGEGSFGSGSGWGGFGGGGGFGSKSRPNPEEERRRKEAKKFIDEELPTHTWKAIRESSSLQLRIKDVSKYYAWETQRALLNISLGTATDWEDLLFWSMSFIVDFKFQRLPLSASTLTDWFFDRTQEYVESLNRSIWARLISRLEASASVKNSCGRGIVLYENLLRAIPRSNWVAMYPDKFLDLYLELLERFENTDNHINKNDCLESFYRTLHYFSKNRYIKKQLFLDQAERLIKLDMMLNPQESYGNAGIIFDIYFQNAGDRMIHFLTQPVQSGDDRLPLFYDNQTRFVGHLAAPQFYAMAQIIQNDYLPQWNSRAETRVNMYQEVLALFFLFTLDNNTFFNSKKQVSPELYLDRLNLLHRILTHQTIFIGDPQAEFFIRADINSFNPQLLSDDMPLEKMQAYKNGVFQLLSVLTQDEYNSYKQSLLLQKLIRSAKKYSNLKLFSSIDVLGQWLRVESLIIAMPDNEADQESTVAALAEISAYYLEHSENKSTEWTQWFLKFQTQNPHVSGAGMIRDIMNYLPMNDRRVMTELLWQEVKKEAGNQ